MAAPTLPEAEIVRLHRAGSSTHEIAVAVGHSQQGCWKLLVRLGEVESRGLTAAERRERSAIFMKSYNSRPDVQARNRSLQQDPEYKTRRRPRRKEYNASERGRASHQATDNARRAPTEGFYTVGEWTALKAQHGHRCLRCDKTEKQLKRLGRALSADHVVPLLWKGPELRGHRNEIHNIQPLCFGPDGCNNAKGCSVADYRR